MFETATKYILDLLTENEELKKFPKEFVDESVKWVKSWFLTPEDPKTTAKLTSPNKSVEYKKDVIDDKLEELQENPQFTKELAERIVAFEQQRAKLKNVVSDADIDVKGSVHIGDKGSSSGDNYDEKNIIKGGTIKAGGDFRLGDDVISGNQNVQIVHHHYDENAKMPMTRRKILIWGSSILASISAAIGLNLHKQNEKVEENKPEEQPKINVQGNNNVINDMSGSNQNVINQTIVQKGKKDSLNTKK